ncbi:MAG: hypothetical protein LBE92_03120 [Chryseobacterium sp.]|uniref:hypothetical protein n=1 Tax=Chryseobacterium sp. TaxID=1871047 RepID=UPI0028188B4D|nr:hypothetical protein [Chryseobacterium sp.]MDR2235090.1 hypothetical protein [Chryseobacterium sp.]
MNLPANRQVIFIKILAVLMLVISLGAKAQKSEFDITGTWKATDYWNNESEAVFTEDGYISMTTGGEKVDGKNFIIRGGVNNGQKGELKFEINQEKNPVQIDIIALKDEQEKGRILGIIIPVHQTKFLMLLGINGKRPGRLNDDNTKEVLTLIKQN